MTIQDLGPSQSSIIDYPLKKISSALPSLTSLFFSTRNEEDSNFLNRTLLNIGCVSVAGIGVAAATYYIFKTRLQLSAAQKEDLEEDAGILQGSLQEPNSRTFVDKLLNETCEITQRNFDRLMADGDKAVRETLLNDAEQYYADALKAISSKDDSSGIKCSKKLGVVYLERAKQAGFIEERKEDCIKAAGLLNYSLLLASKQNDEELQEEILKKLNEIEDLICFLCKIIPNKREDLDSQNRESLRKIREDTQFKLRGTFDSPEEVRELFEDITLKMKIFTACLIEQSLKILGSPPLDCEFAIIGLGSMAREEMTSFSDLEFAVLVEEGKDTEELKQYFRDLTYLIHLRVLNLRETIVPTLGIKALEGFYDGVTLRGFAFDGKSPLGRGYKTPLGKKGVFELIQTPKKMAEFQGKNGDKYWYDQDPFLPTELHNITYIYGKEELAKAYRKELGSALEQESNENSSLLSYYAKKHLFEEDEIAFKPDFEHDEEGMLFELKKDLYRMPHLFIERLFLIECDKRSAGGKLVEDESLNGTFSKIKWLVEKGVLGPEGADNLKWMFGKVLLVRLKNSYETKSAKSIEDPLSSSSGGVDEKICNINFLFCKAVKENLNGQTSLHDQIFYSDDPFLAAQIKMRLGKYLGVEECVRQHLEATPSDVEAVFLAARVYYKLGDEKLTGETLDKATDLISELQEANEKIYYLLQVGALYQHIGEYVQGPRLIEKAWTLAKDDASLTLSFNVLRNCTNTFHVGVKDFKKTQEVLEQNLQALKTVQGKLNERRYSILVASILKNLASTHHFQNNTKDSIKYTEECLAIQQKVYGRGHPDVAETLTDLGHRYFNAGAHEKGIQHLREGLDITTARFGEFHKDSIRRYLELSNSLNEIYPSKGKVQYAYLVRAEKVETRHSPTSFSMALAWMEIN